VAHRIFLLADGLPFVGFKGWVASAGGGAAPFGFRGRLNISEDYCGYCLMLVTRMPVKRTNTVFDGGWP
jgi:hypothetical protein